MPEEWALASEKVEAGKQRKATRGANIMNPKMGMPPHPSVVEREAVQQHYGPQGVSRPWMMSEEMSPQERHILQTQGPASLGGMQGAAMFAPAVSAALGRGRPDVFPEEEANTASAIVDYLVGLAALLGTPLIASRTALGRGLMPAAGGMTGGR